MLDDKMVGAFIVANKEQFYKIKESEDKQISKEEIENNRIPQQIAKVLRY